MEESLLRSEFIEKQVSRKLSSVNNYPALDMLYTLKNGNILQAKAIIK